MRLHLVQIRVFFFGYSVFSPSWCPYGRLPNPLCQPTNTLALSRHPCTVTCHIMRRGKSLVIGQCGWSLLSVPVHMDYFPSPLKPLSLLFTLSSFLNSVLLYYKAFCQFLVSSNSLWSHLAFHPRFWSLFPPIVSLPFGGVCSSLIFLLDFHCCCLLCMLVWCV